VLNLHRSVRNARKHGHTYKAADAVLDDVFDTILCDVMDRGLSLG
jgi:hypothetical protein